MLTLAQNLAEGWLRHFYSADHSIAWGNIEKEHSLWLDDKTLLVGRIDADGTTEDGDFFFADWKTISGRYKNSMAKVKAEYRFDPQMLTYGLLTQASGGKRFMVRWAMKPLKESDPPLYFHEWYRYSDSEVAWWREMVLKIAAKIREDRATMKPFVTNLGKCHQWYGRPCEFLSCACIKQQWDGVDPTMTKRVSHLEIERQIQTGLLPRSIDFDTGETRGWEDVTILDATRIDTWLSCNERYRREYICNDRPEAGESLSIGLEFHDLMHRYYTSLKEPK